jgi:hypothetical protein
MTKKLRRPSALVGGIIVIVYSLGYLATTNLRPGGTGGLSGPVTVRVFKSERHLIAFYPLYLMERWVRNLSLTDADYHFNVDFLDGKYDRDWLYGDGKYSRIWYSF